MVRKEIKNTKELNRCPSDLEVIDTISGKWTVLIVYTLSEGTKRFGELGRAVPGISEKVLTQNLRRLERDGVIRRKVYPVVPPQVEYSLTPIGNSLVKLLSNLRNWATQNYPEIKKNRTKYDKRVNGRKN
jgi:DNA-binding HxlR family transcriptional regulator